MKAEIFTKKNIVFKDAEELRCFIGGTTYRFGDASLPRVLEHLHNGAFIISAMKGGFPVGKTYEEFTPDEKATYRNNINATNELKAKLKAKGLGYIPSLGGFIESDKKTGQEINVNEFSFIVPKPANMDSKTFVDIAMGLAKEYDQDSVMVGGIPEIDNGQIRYLSPSKAVDIAWDIDPNAKFSKATVYKKLDLENRPYYTQPKKTGPRNFTFDSESKRTVSHIIGIDENY